MTPTRYRFVIEALLFVTYALFGLSWIGVTPLIPELQRRFAISSAEVGLMNTAVSLAKVVAPLLTGYLAVRLGLKRTILLGSACIGSAIAAPLVRSYRLFLLSRFVFGLGGAVVVTLLGPAVLRWFPRRELAVVNALNNVAANTGIALALFATVPLASALGASGTLTLYAALNLLLLGAWALLGREGDAPTPTAALAPARYRDVWRRRETWLATLAFASTLALYLAFNTWLPRYYVEVFGLSPAAAARATGLFNLVGIPSAILGGVLTARLGRRRPFLIGAGLLVSAAAFGMFLHPSPLLITASAIALGVAFFIAGSPLFTTVMELPGVTPAHLSLIMGTLFSVSYVISSCSPVVVGLLRDRTGSFLPGLVLWSLLASGLALAGLLLPETGPAGRARREALAI